MTRTRRATLGLVPLGGAALLAGCGGDPPPPPPPPTKVVLTLRAAPGVNPDGSGAAKPLRVRVLQLKSAQALEQTDFFTFDPDPGAVLKADLVASEELVLAPGQEEVRTFEPEPQVRLIGVAGSYFDVDRARWRAWTEPLASNATTEVLAVLEADGITLVAKVLPPEPGPEG